MIVAFSRITTEAVLSGSARDYRTLATALQQGTGQRRLESPDDVSPYDQAFIALQIQTITTPMVKISTDQAMETLIITGAAQHLAILADIISDSAHAAKTGGHVHLEAFEGHEFLAQDSVPFVVMNAH